MTQSKRPTSDDASKRVSKDEASSGNFADAVKSIGNVEPLDRSNVVQQAPAGSHGTRTEARTKTSSRHRTIVVGEDEPSGAAPSLPGTIPKPRNVAGSKATRTQMRRLRAGKLRPERVVDLHGFSQDQAYRSLCNAIARAVDEGVRCVLIIHGRVWLLIIKLRSMIKKTAV